MASKTAALMQLKSHIKLSSSATPALQSSSWYLIAAATSTALGIAPAWVPSVYRTAVADLPSLKAPATRAYADDPSPRRRVVRQLKEAIFKSHVLIGIPKAIEASLALKAALDDGDRDTTFVRKDFALDDVNAKRGMSGLRRVYRSNLDGIFDAFGDELQEMQWISQNVTYGLFLAATTDDPSTPAASLDWQETEVVILSCLIAQGAKRETLWHLRGAQRSGLSNDDIEHLQCAIEEAIRSQGKDIVPDMPRARDIKEQDDLSAESED
ncbi:uncharacterized protein L969DRAFT_42607 [Mixia osmundae IAM 14324]|uniref:Carboxymuconolactone decarboxylase-like domain-containing protein n=1 Tax=Mixia osmundae (strain CBS 9802 / IAM 14324 / JCM 22182 / KY 12970) TaxID=764103 RepID=G7DVC8_MIXOS|nr:uncharacterized protein L969DRAFT_42607 [Mixia osmundae IAM 14324]KEI42041.1 hypothetical protein L969DRAFT_42607 [Mixia osmundae IAM 14324]GAA94538.1 hypothetical protein E5Q_01190 [Mixia osmundae IAM 14324]